MNLAELFPPLRCRFNCDDLVTGTMIDDETGVRFFVCTKHTDLEIAKECGLRYVSSFGPA